MGILGIFKKVGQTKKKVDKQEKGEPVDNTIYKIGVYGHKGVGKTVFFTVAYANSKQSPDFELMALGETQELLEEKYNLMRGQGMDLATGNRLAGRRFPPLSTGEQKLNFDVRVGHRPLIPINTIDYSGELVYIDARGEIKQKLLEFFKNCECVLFFIDPEAISNEGERSNRIAAFTDLIGQLSGREKKLKIPIGLVISKADELRDFKSAEQSVLVGKGYGYIRALNFSGFLHGVLKQRLLQNRPDWKDELSQLLNRLESFFKPLLNRTMDYQVFFISSTGNPPEVTTDQTGARVRIPPLDLSPLGVSQPLRWAINRISSQRRAVVYRGILKWAFLFIALIIDLAAFGYVYNDMKLKRLYRNVSGESRALSDVNKNIANHYKKYADDFIIQTFFGDFSDRAMQESHYYMSIGSKQATAEMQSKFSRQMTSIDADLAIFPSLSSDTAKYVAARAVIIGKLDSAASFVARVSDPGMKTEMQTQIDTRKKQLESAPTPGELVATQDIMQQYEVLKGKFKEGLANHNYDYLLDPAQFPTELAAFRDNVLAANPENAQVINYNRNIKNYLNAIANFSLGITIPFSVVGAGGGENGYSLYFGGAPEAPEGDVSSNRADLLLRVPVANEFNIIVRKGGVDTHQSYTIGKGYSVLKLNNRRLEFTDQEMDIRLIFDLDSVFLSRFRNQLL